MWSQIVLCLFVGLAYASNSNNPAWKDNTQYVYQVTGRTLSSLQDTADQYSGIFLKAKLHISSQSNGKLQGRITDTQYAQIQSQMPDGWMSEIPESQLSYKSLSLSQKPFQIVIKNGLVKKLIVEKDLSNWEANIIKSIVSQFQLDLQGQNAIDSPVNSIPRKGKFDGVFQTMEETVTGKTETLYDIHPLPQYLIQSKPWLAPKMNLGGEENVIEVIKSKNFTNAEDRPSFNYGFGQIDESEPTSNKMGQFFIRESTSRAIVTGIPSKYIIQSSVSINKIMVNPSAKNQNMGSVISMVNVTLSEVNNQQEQSQELSDPIDIGNLVYTYETPFAKKDQVHKKLEGSLRSEEDDSQDEQSSETTWKKIRQSSRQLIRKQNSEESSEENNQRQRRPQMNKAPESPLLPTMMGYHGKSIKENRDFDIKQNAEKLAQEVAEEIQKPEKIVTESTLEKYTIISKLVRMMDEDDIKSVAEQLYTQSTQDEKRLPWVVFRDAVAEAGTGPAFLNIQQWIQSKKIQEQEAAEIIGNMARSVRVPTEEYMRKFFELVKDSEVKRQKHLNETAILAYANLVNQVYIKKSESHSQFPAHAFGSFSTKEGKDFVKNTVIPYFAQQLKDSITRDDPSKIHIYIRALGNIGHKKILEAFEPYLEGEKQASQFQRMMMVVAMNRLASSNPEVARSVLHKIYQNRAEIPEIRVIAVYHLMKTNPPADMLQGMAENTNNDNQEQVNAAVKSAIEAASRLNESPKTQQLKEAAQSAKHLLTKKNYAGEQSYIDLRNYVVKQMGLEMRHKFVQVGSQDSDMPKVMKIQLESNMQGMIRDYLKVEWMISSVRDLTNVLYEQTEESQQTKESRNQQRSEENQWSSANIAQQMGLQRKEREQLEAVILTEMENVQKLWHINNQTLEQIPEAVREYENMLKNGKKFSYTKLSQQREMALSFPTEMGIPFVFSYDMPGLVKLEGKIRATATPQLSRGNKLHKPAQISAAVEAEITVSGKVQSHLSFVTPFDHQIYTAGYDRKVQAHIPVKANVDIDLKEKEAKIELEIQEPQKETRLLHFSSYPYTSRSDIMTTRPVSQRPNTRIIKPRNSEQRAFNVHLGKHETGLTFRVWGQHPEQSLSIGQLADELRTKGLTAMLNQLWDESSLQHTEANIAVSSSQSTVRKVTLRYRYDKQYNKQPESAEEKDFIRSNELNSQLQNSDFKQRQQELMQRVGSGIKSARVMNSELSVELEGDQKYKHLIGAVYAKSNSDPSSRVLLYYLNRQQGSQINFEVKAKVPNTNGLDLTESLSVDPTAEYNYRINYKSESNAKESLISGKVRATRSQERREYLTKEDPMYHVCRAQMQQGNRQLPACQNMTIKSNLMDKIDFKLKHENLNKQITESAKAIAETLNVYFWPMSEIQSVSSEGENIVKGSIQFQPKNLRKVNITVTVDDKRLNLYNLTIKNEMVKILLVPHPVFHIGARVQGILKGLPNFRQTCVIDQSAAQTFSNKTYPLNLEDKYTVVMQYVPQNARMSEDQPQTVEEQLRRQTENYVVLARQVSGEQRELIVTLNHPKSHGKTVQIEMKPRQGSSSAQKPAALVSVDGQEVKFDDKESAELHKGLVQIYALPNGEVKLEIQDAFYLIFDGKRVKLTALSQKLRDSINGLCGRFSQDKNEDLTVPSQCVVRDPKTFVESWQVESRKQRRQQRSGEWRQECVEKVLPLYVNVISGRDAGRTERRSENGQQSAGTQLRIRYVEEDGELCFTIRPVPTCNNEARETQTKNIPVHCIQGTKAALYLKKQIDQGGNPDFSRKSETKKVRMEVAMQCN